MIRYSLGCDNGHGFESWFPSSGAYDSQRRRGLVSCPVCGSAEIDKQLMAPQVTRTDRRPEGRKPPAKQEVALMSPDEHDLRRKLAGLRADLVKNSDYVGDRFPDEARAMHDGEIEHRSIWGEATPEEARALAEDGIEVAPLPPKFEDRN